MDDPVEDGDAFASPFALAPGDGVRSGTSAREVPYTVVGREAKYKAKTAIETVVYRGGDALAGWLSAGLAALGVGFAALTLAAMPLAALWAALGVWLGRRQDERLLATAHNAAPKAPHDDRPAA